MEIKQTEEQVAAVLMEPHRGGRTRSVERATPSEFTVPQKIEMITNFVGREHRISLHDDAKEFLASDAARIDVSAAADYALPLKKIRFLQECITTLIEESSEIVSGHSIDIDLETPANVDVNLERLNKPLALYEHNLSFAQEVNPDPQSHVNVEFKRRMGELFNTTFTQHINTARNDLAGDFSAWADAIEGQKLPSSPEAINEAARLLEGAGNIARYIATILPTMELGLSTGTGAGRGAMRGKPPAD